MTVASINTELAKIPMTMTHATALSILRAAVYAKYPPMYADAPNTRRHVRENNTHRHGGYGRGGIDILGNLVRGARQFGNVNGQIAETLWHGPSNPIQALQAGNRDRGVGSPIRWPDL